MSESTAAHRRTAHLIGSRLSLSRERIEHYVVHFKPSLAIDETEPLADDVGASTSTTTTTTATSDAVQIGRVTLHRSALPTTPALAADTKSSSTRQLGEFALTSVAARVLEKVLIFAFCKDVFSFV